MDSKGRLFKVGGKRKELFPKTFLIVDDIIVKFRNRIPLWLFGFLY